jgi:hypothetical protein
MNFAQHHRSAPPWDIRRPPANATRRTDTDPIGVHIFVWYEALFVFHINPSDEFCISPPTDHHPWLRAGRTLIHLGCILLCGMRLLLPFT